MSNKHSKIFFSAFALCLSFDLAGQINRMDQEIELALPEVAQKKSPKSQALWGPIISFGSPYRIKLNCWNFTNSFPSKSR